MAVVVLAFVAGCAGSALAKLVAPPARAQSTPRLEYLAHNDSNRVDIADWQKLGAEGWEFAGVGTSESILKRPLP